MRSSALVFVSLCAAACYSPTPANGAWICSAGTQACPSGYYCAADNTCWKNDTKPDGGGSPSCAGSKAPLCEDFESGAINASVWSMSTMGGQVGVDGEHAHRGSFALHSHTNFAANTSLAIAQITATHKLFPMLQAGFYARAFVYIPSPAPMEPDALFYAARGSSGGVNFGLDAGQVQIYDIENSASTSSSMSMPTDNWVCLEWSLDGDTSRVWVDGMQLHDLDYSGSAKGGYEALSFGTNLFNPSNQSPTDLWIDDIIVDTSQIGCTQ